MLYDAAALLTFLSPASFIPDHITESLEALLETDWCSAAAVLLQEREEEVHAGKDSCVRKRALCLIN